MFGLFKFQLKPVHEIPEGSIFHWEGILDRIYKNLNKEFDSFLAIASNTEKGELRGHITFRIKENIDEVNHENILSINSIIFDAFFSQYTKQNILDHTDMYHLNKKKNILEYSRYIGRIMDALYGDRPRHERMREELSDRTK